MTTNQTPAKKSSAAGLAWCVGIGVVVLIVIGAMSGNSSSSSSSSTKSANSSLACTHFHNVIGDIQAGVLSDNEIRTKIAEVRDSAIDPAVAKAATHLLAGVTQNSKSQVSTGFAELVKACA